MTTSAAVSQRHILGLPGPLASLMTGLLVLSGAVSGMAAETGEKPNAGELQVHYASRQAALAETFAQAEAVVNGIAARRAARTAIYRPEKDRFGDPMYVAYGRRAYAGTPWYSGPAYVSSFEIEPQIPYEVLYGRASLYWPGALSNPGYVPRTDMSLGVGASHSYMQHGMVMDPGSVAPSYARPMQFNRY